LKIVDLTQFYSPVSGGVKRYLHEKIAYIQDCMSKDKHVLVIPGKKTTVRANGRSRVYTIRAPLVSRTAQYRALRSTKFCETSDRTSLSQAILINLAGKPFEPDAR